MKALRDWHLAAFSSITAILILLYYKLMIPFYDGNMAMRITENFSWSPGIAIHFWVNMVGSIFFGGSIAYFSLKRVSGDYDWRERLLFCIAMIVLAILVIDIAILVLPKSFIEYRFSQPIFNSVYSSYIYSICLPLIMLNGYLLKSKSLDIWTILPIICFGVIGCSLSRNIVFGLAYSLVMFLCLGSFLIGMKIRKLTKRNQKEE